ncbi:MAG: hypothetical protein AABZ33_14335 [Chloroflexota bacterium]
MTESQGLLALIVAAVIGLAASILILGRLRRDARDATGDSPYAASTEGETRCPRCGMGNLWTDRECIACGAKLPE